MKTHRGSAKRFRVTGGGKVKRWHNFTSHTLEKKSSKRMRRLHRPAYVSDADRRRVEHLLPYR